MACAGWFLRTVQMNDPPQILLHSHRVGETRAIGRTRMPILGAARRGEERSDEGRC